jgi:hypothetical protein
LKAAANVVPDPPPLARRYGAREGRYLPESPCSLARIFQQGDDLADRSLQELLPRVGVCGMSGAVADPAPDALARVLEDVGVVDQPPRDLTVQRQAPLLREFVPIHGTILTLLAPDRARGFDHSVQLRAHVRLGDRWGRLGVEQLLSPIDGLLAATALQHDLAFVTRNVADVARSGVDVLNPFSR